MKKIILVFLTVACSLPALCQTDTLRQQLNTLFGNLNAAQVPSGYLAPQGAELVDKEDFNGVLADSNMVNDLDLVRLLYADVYTSRFYSAAPNMPTVDALNTAINGTTDNTLVLFYVQ